MEPPKYQRKFEELQRAYTRIEKLYNGQIINEPGEDSFQSPKDVVLNFFRVCYELKEALKKAPNTSQGLQGHNGLVETFCNNEPCIALSLDIANQEKHVGLNNSRSGKQIGVINTHLHMLSHDRHDRTELTIEIDGKKEDCRTLADNILKAWEKFFKVNNL